MYRRLRVEGRSPSGARQAAFDAYLDGKPQASGKLKPTRHERDNWFWGSEFVGACCPEDWCTEAGTLALARYLSQARVVVLHEGQRIGFVNRALKGMFYRWMHSGHVTATVERQNGKPQRPLIFVRISIA